MALKFGKVCRTLAVQAGLTHRRLSFRDVFGRGISSRPCTVVFRLPQRRSSAGNLTAASSARGM